MKALIIIDCQNDFMPGGVLAVPQGDKIIPLINRLQRYYDLVVATQDWHPANHISFASQHPDKKPFDKITISGRKQILWPDHCVAGTPGAGFHPDLDTRRISAIFRKGMDPEIDSYSGFYDNGHLVSTGLAGYLKEKRVTKLDFCGLAADICVYYSIKDAISEGFSVTMVEAATRPLVFADYFKIKAEIEKMGVRIICTEEVNDD